ncbi:hypothetical protein Tco_1523501 [Tanacetum coccineum]
MPSVSLLPKCLIHVGSIALSSHVRLLLDSIYVRSSHTLAAEEAQIQRTAPSMILLPLKGLLNIQRTADFQGTAEPHDAASIPKSPNDYTPTVWNKDEGILSEEHKVQEEDLAHPFFDDTADQRCCLHLIIGNKSDELKNKSIETKRSIGAILFPYNLNLNSNSRALETTNDDEGCRKIQAEWDAEEERKRQASIKTPSRLVPMVQRKKGRLLKGKRCTKTLKEEEKLNTASTSSSSQVDDHKTIDDLRETIFVAQSALISELQSADHRRQGTQMTEFQRQHRPVKGSAQPDAPGEAGSSS